MNTHLVQVRAALGSHTKLASCLPVYFSLCSLLTDEHYGDEHESFYITKIKLSEAPNAGRVLKMKR